MANIAPFVALIFPHKILYIHIYIVLYSYVHIYKCIYNYMYVAMYLRVAIIIYNMYIHTW